MPLPAVHLLSGRARSGIHGVLPPPGRPPRAPHGAVRSTVRPRAAAVATASTVSLPAPSLVEPVGYVVGVVSVVSVVSVVGVVGVVGDPPSPGIAPEAFSTEGTRRGRGRVAPTSSAERSRIPAA